MIEVLVRDFENRILPCFQGRLRQPSEDKNILHICFQVREGLSPKATSLATYIIVWTGGTFDSFNMRLNNISSIPDTLYLRDCDVSLLSGQILFQKLFDVPTRTGDQFPRSFVILVGCLALKTIGTQNNYVHHSTMIFKGSKRIRFFNDVQRVSFSV